MAYAALQHRAIDASGNLLTNVDIRVKREIAGQPLAVLYSDRDGNTQISNPTVGGFFADGKIRVHVIGGAYQVELLISGVVVDTFRYVAVGRGAEGDFGLGDAWVTPEMFGPVGTANDDAVVQAAIDSGKSVMILQNHQFVAGVTMTASFNGKKLCGVNDSTLFFSENAIPLLTLDSSGGEITRVTIESLGLLGDSDVTGEAGILLMGDEFIQDNSFLNLRFWNTDSGIKDVTAVSENNWNTYTNLKFQQTVERGLYFTKGSGTGNTITSCTFKTSVAGIQYGDGTEDVGDIIIAGCHFGGSGAGIKAIGGNSYGHLLSGGACQFDAGLTYSLDLEDMQRVSFAATNWGGGTDVRFVNCTSIDLQLSYVVTPTQVTANQNNYSPTDLAYAKALRVSTDASRQFTGLAKGWDGRNLRWINAGAQDQVLVDSSGSSSVGSRFYFGGQNITVRPGYHVDLVYDGANGVWQGSVALTPMTSAQLAALLTDETGSGAAVFGTSPTISAATLSGTTNLTGGQIAFPASQSASANANTLDDYEEFTFTPVFSFAAAGDWAGTYNIQLAFGTKVGNCVTYQIDVSFSAFTHTSASGNAQITGSPFTAAASPSVQRGGLRWNGITKTNYTEMTCGFSAGTATMIFTGSGSGQAASNIVAADMPTGGTPRLSCYGHYYV